MFNKCYDASMGWYDASMGFFIKDKQMDDITQGETKAIYATDKDTGGMVLT